MAGYWIPVDVSLRDKAEVVRIVLDTNGTPSEVVGRLVLLWCLAAKMSDDSGYLSGYTIDHLVALVGGDPDFWAAVQAAGWLVVHDHGLEIPDWDVHFGPDAVRKAKDRRRKQIQRDADREKAAAVPAPSEPVRDLSADCPTPSADCPPTSTATPEFSPLPLPSPSPEPSPLPKRDDDDESLCFHATEWEQARALAREWVGTAAGPGRWSHPPTIPEIRQAKAGRRGDPYRVRFNVEAAEADRRDLIRLAALVLAGRLSHDTVAAAARNTVACPNPIAKPIAYLLQCVCQSAEGQALDLAAVLPRLDPPADIVATPKPQKVDQ